jgi:hypothetical protein
MSGRKAAEKQGLLRNRKKIEDRRKL